MFTLIQCANIYSVSSVFKKDVSVSPAKFCTEENNLYQLIHKRKKSVP